MLDDSHVAHRTITETPRIPVTSLNPPTARSIRDIVIAGTTMLHPTPEPPTSPPASSPAAVSLQRNPDLLTSPHSPFPTFSNTVLDSMPPTGPPPSSRSPVTRSDLSLSYPKSYRSVIVTTAPSASPEPTSTLDLDAAVVGDGIPKPGSHEEKGALDNPWVSMNPT
ncbi:hypothetical protein EDB83DRAFT_2392799 [Lactarius deliciosus]|nr:hypothetical protein EDB83DRAFT_2392799 [Lactarius deliciosus]